MLPYVFLDTEEMVEKHGHIGYVKNEVIGLKHGMQLLGYLEFRDDGDNELFIEMIQVEEHVRNQGHAERLLKEALRYYPETKAFTGLSFPKAVPYWQKKGALFEPQTFESYLKNDIYEGENFPFACPVTADYQPYWLKS